MSYESDGSTFDNTGYLIFLEKDKNINPGSPIIDVEGVSGDDTEDEDDVNDDTAYFDDDQGWKFMSCSHCQELDQQASKLASDWLNKSEQPIRSQVIKLTRLQLISFRP